MPTSVTLTQAVQFEYFEYDGTATGWWVEVPGSGGSQWMIATSGGPLPSGMVSKSSNIDAQIGILQTLKDSIPEPEDPETTEIWATCRTEGCGSNGIPIHIVGKPPFSIICGPCGQPVTDISYTEPEEGEELPEWTSEA